MRQSRYRIAARAALMTLAVSLVAGCKVEEPPLQDAAVQLSPEQRKDGDSHYVQNRGADTVVVFFHGLFGDALGTWRASDAKQSFPELVATDSTVVLEPGTPLEVRDVSVSNCRMERGPEHWCKPGESILWIRVGLRPQWVSTQRTVRIGES